jgi:hypothetical protein
MSNRKLSEKDKVEKRIKKAINSIRKLEKYYGEHVLSLACNRYSTLCREKRKALSEKDELEQKLAEVKEKLK